jgi:hypothetical protein
MFLFKRAELPLIKIQMPTAAEVCQKFEPNPAALALLVPTQTPAGFLQALEKNPLSGEAVKFLAQALPEREAVWWLCQSSRVVESSLNRAEMEALAAAEKWVREPSSANREAAGETAAKTDMTGPGGWAAQAAAWSQPPATAKPKPGKSDLPKDPTAGLTAPAVAGGILLAAGLVGKPVMPEVKRPDLSLPAVTMPGMPAVNIALPAVPAISIPQPAMSGLALPQPGMPGAPVLTMPQAPGLNISAPAIPGVQMPSVTAPQIPGAPQLQAPAINVSAPALPGMPSMPALSTAPAIAKPEIPPLDQKKLAKMLRAFLEVGRGVASGENVWA